MEQEELTQQEEKKSVVDRVVDGIVSDIIDGKLKPGDKLPTEPELSQKFQAGRNSVREAIKKLEANGVVYIKRADGTFVSETYSHKLLDPMLYSIILQKNSWRDFVELRSVLDIGTLEVLVAEEGNQENFNELRVLLLQMESAFLEEEPSSDKILDLDTQFHTAIAARTHNPQLLTITEYITRLTIPSRRRAVCDILKNKDMERFIQLHREWIQVLEQKDASHIVETVKNHYIFWENSV